MARVSQWVAGARPRTLPAGVAPVVLGTAAAHLLGAADLVMALLALEMREAMRADDTVSHLGLELRIGINSGPVVAGVIGRKRFLYDLWGDAVNMASRMESQGTPGRIQITQATHDLIANEFDCSIKKMPV